LETYPLEGKFFARLETKFGEMEGFVGKTFEENIRKYLLFLYQKLAETARYCVWVLSYVGNSRL
jgi:hypothetical protein